MRSCCAVYVDVGYLLAAAATRVTGSSLRRGVQTDYAAIIDALKAQAEADSGLPLLRVNWYDAGGRPGGMPDLTQDEIGLLPNVKLRLGRLSYSGEQKGVDVRIGLDLAIQARQGVADVVYLVSGDDDLTEAVEEVQSRGVQVVLLAVPRHDGRPLSVAQHLMREVDRTLVIDAEAIDAAVRPNAIPEALVPESGGDGAREADADAGPAAEGAPTPARVRVRRRITHGAGQAEPAEATPSPPTPTAPSPAMFATRKAAAVALPESAPAPAVPAGADGVTLGVIDAVAGQVVAAWCASATPDALLALKAGAPTIPAELDRALLVDLASHEDGRDLDDEARHQIRARFWHHIGRVRPV